MTMATLEAAPPPELIEAAGGRRFRPVRHLGAGPEGSAMLAFDATVGATVELRNVARVRANPDRWSALRARMKLSRMVAHPACRTPDLYEPEGEEPAVVLPWPDGAATLEDRACTLARTRALGVLVSLAGALEAAHALGLHHGDLGPQTVLLDGEGRPHVEFTGVRTLGAAMLSERHLRCRAPEHDAEPADATTDAYALAALTVYLLAGAAPTSEALAPLAALDPALPDALAAALSADRDARPPAGELRALFARAAERSSSADREALSHTLEGGPTRIESGTGTGSASARGAALAPGDVVGRFRLVRELGSGGMGVVYEGVDEADGQRVAVKVLRPEVAHDAVLFRRFRKEARLLAAARNPHVAALLDVNVQGDTHFLALEYMPGGSLEAYLEDRRKLEPTDALEIAAEVCRALADPHRRGIVHRDVKPDNVMFARADRRRGPDGVRVKLCDFGIARDERAERGGETVKLTRDGAVLGTPLYMAPEQCAGRATTPATDVYALGVMLFTLVAGAPPFDGDEPVALMLQHLSTPAPALRTRAPAASEALERIVERALRKDASERFADAGEMLEALERILRGEPTGIEVHPMIPRVDPKDLFVRAYEWVLPGTPEQLWPYVGDNTGTGRWLGLPELSYRWESAPGNDGKMRRRVWAGAGPGKMEWIEQPHEWVEGRTVSFYRVFEKGPMRWLAWSLELFRRDEHSTTMRITTRILPRGFVNRLIAQLLLDKVQKPGVDRGVQRLKAYLDGQLGHGPAVNPWMPPPALPRASLAKIDRAVEELLRRGLEPRYVEAVADFVRASPDYEASRVRPLAFARKHGLDPERTVQTFLHAAKCGLVALGWDVICPLCRVPSSFVDSLEGVGDHANCPACAMDFRLDFSRSIELIFRASPAIRRGEPVNLCTNGPQVYPHIVAQVRLAPGERMALSLRLSPGEYRVGSPQASTTLDVGVAPDHAPGRAELQLGPAFRGRAELRTGDQVLVLTNGLDTEAMVRVERALVRDDALTAARATSMPLFRELFPHEVLAPGRMVSVADATLAVLAFSEGDGLYTALGDARAFELLYGQFTRWGELVGKRGGTVLKTVDGALLAAFETPAAAVGCALDAVRAGGERAVQAAVHRGAMMATTVNGRVDLFGAHAAAALRLGAFAAPGAVALSPAVGDEESVQARLAGTSTEVRALSGRGAPVPYVVLAR